MRQLAWAGIFISFFAFSMDQLNLRYDIAYNINHSLSPHDRINKQTFLDLLPIELMLELYQFRFNQTATKTLANSILSGHISAISNALYDAADPNCVLVNNNSTKTLIGYIITHYHPYQAIILVRTLLKYHANPNQKNYNPHECSNLFLAAQKNIDITRILLNAHANPFVKELTSTGSYAYLFVHPDIADNIKSLIAERAKKMNPGLFVHLKEPSRP